MKDIKIIFEDDDILVIDKPSGMTVNKSDTTKGEFTLQDWIEKNFKFRAAVKAFGDARQISNIKSKEEETDFYKRAGIVHRIDKETSGILIVAKNKESFENLQAQFRERKVNKIYVALVHGKVDPPEGEIVVPVGRLPWNRKRFGVLAGGRPAITKYKVLSVMYKISGKSREQLTLLELSPKTGRTHQIRVHLKYFNHPIFGDFLYAGRKTAREDRKILDRLFLHAEKISFLHPTKAERVEFKSNLAQELEKVIELIKH